MATLLPAIHSPMGPKHHITSEPTKNGVSAGQIIITHNKRTQGRKEKDLELRRQQLRAQQPVLNKKQTAQYCNSYKHNLCLDMLQQGFHKSFAELFALIKQQNAERERAGPESSMWNQVQLENEPDKLDTLKDYLTKAEIAERNENFVEVYKCQFKLASYFQQTGDKWLADHFYSACLATSSLVENGEGKLAAEGHCNMGLALEKSGDYFGAAENFELFYKLSKDKPDWCLSDGTLMQSVTCNHLSRCYTTIAFEYEANGDLKLYLEYLKKAYDMAKEGGDRKLIGEVSFRLGLAYEKNKDSPTALMYLNGYLDICQALEDSVGIGKACEAIAKSYESENKIEEAIKYLEMFVEVAERSKDDKAISQSCSDLGAMFNSLGKYEQAVEYFNKSYNIARAMNDNETISSSRVLFGVAAAHKMLSSVAQHIEIGTKPCLQRLVEWKDNRGDDFDKPIPQPAALTKKTGEGNEEAKSSSSLDSEDKSSDDENKNNNNNAETPPAEEEPVAEENKDADS